MVRPPFDALAPWYDAVYAVRGKAHRAEADAALRAAGHPGLPADVAGTAVPISGATEPTLAGETPPPRLLDVACGTGSHLQWFQCVTRAEGLDAHPDMRRIAQEKLPGVTIHSGDMRSFRRPDRFDIITCLFASIGYLADHADLDAAIMTMGMHLAPGGRLVIQPPLFPADVQPAEVQHDRATIGHRVVTRRTTAERNGDVLHVQFSLTIEAGIDTEIDAGNAAGSEGRPERHVETHHIRLFAPDDYAAAFDAAGLAAELVDARGLGRVFVAVSTG
ncbi:MAG: trans-aconitate 2-methyltransferase [Phycisphaerales bacterium]